MDREVKMLKVKKVGKITGVNIDKTKYMIMYRDQNAGRSRNIETGNSSFESVEQFKFLGAS